MPSLSDLKPGRQVRGRVVISSEHFVLINLVDVLGVEGFVHLALDSSRRTTQRGTLAPGQEVNAWVLDANPLTCRVALSLHDPASIVRLDTLKPGQRLDGEVVSLRNEFGAFIDFGAPSQGLLPNNEIDRARRRGMREPVVGERLPVYINWVNLKEKKVSLRMLPSPRIRVDDLRIGLDYNGYVSHITDFGAFVDIDAEQDGMIHISDISTDYVRNIHDYLTENQLVKVRVVSIDRTDPNKPKIKLNMKDVGTYG